MWTRKLEKILNKFEEQIQELERELASTQTASKGDNEMGDCNNQGKAF